jgi:hypothetical protein
MIKLYKVVNTDLTYIYSTKYFDRLINWCKDILPDYESGDNPSFEDIVKEIESAKMYLITK